MRCHMLHPKIRENLLKIISCITAGVPTEEIILFGSYAYGEPRSNSDLDIMVITRIPDTNTPEWYSKIWSMFCREIDMPVDLVVYPRVFFEDQSNLGWFEKDVLSDGIRIYKDGQIDKELELGISLGTEEKEPPKKYHKDMPEIQAWLELIVSRVIKAVPTDEIILFGSYAYGEPRAKSNLNICVITSIPDTNTAEWYSRIASSFVYDVDISVELLIYPRGFLEERAQLYRFDEKILRDGIRIYRSSEQEDKLRAG